MAFKFKKLTVWQKSLNMSNEIHLLTRKYPKEELFMLTSQIKRAADSVCLNIAEGSRGISNKEFARFLGIANRSAIEVVACLYISQKRNYISDEIFTCFYDYLTVIVKMIQALRKSLLN